MYASATNKRTGGASGSSAIRDRTAPSLLEGVVAGTAADSGGTGTEQVGQGVGRQSTGIRARHAQGGNEETPVSPSSKLRGGYGMVSTEGAWPVDITI